MCVRRKPGGLKIHPLSDRGGSRADFLAGGWEVFTAKSIIYEWRNDKMDVLSDDVVY